MYMCLFVNLDSSEIKQDTGIRIVKYILKHHPNALSLWHFVQYTLWLPLELVTGSIYIYV